MNRLRSETGGILAKLVIFLGLLGLGGFEAGAVIVASVQASGTADTAANEAALVFGNTGSSAKAEDAAANSARQGDAEVVGFEVDAKNDLVSVTLRKKARTLFIHRIPGLKEKTVVETTSEGRVR